MSMMKALIALITLASFLPTANAQRGPGNVECSNPGPRPANCAGGGNAPAASWGKQPSPSKSVYACREECLQRLAGEQRDCIPLRGQEHTRCMKHAGDSWRSCRDNC